jgi:hypothetical protein
MKQDNKMKQALKVLNDLVTATKVLAAEYLVAISVQTVRAKDQLRAMAFLETGVLDMHKVRRFHCAALGLQHDPKKIGPLISANESVAHFHHAFAEIRGKTTPACGTMKPSNQRLRRDLSSVAFRAEAD